MLNSEDECIAQDDDINFEADTFDELIQTCPLRILPEKKNYTVPTSNYEVQKNLLAEGWNACVDKIIGNKGEVKNDRKKRFVSRENGHKR